MRFHVKRTSVWNDTESPVAGAYRGPWVRVDERTTDDPKKILAHHGSDGGWYTTGRNHRVVKGHIMRDFDDEGWFLDVATLDDLVALTQREGNVIVSATDYDDPTTPKIEIYDGYRE